MNNQTGPVKDDAGAFGGVLAKFFAREERVEDETWIGLSCLLDLFRLYRSRI